MKKLKKMGPGGPQLFPAPSLEFQNTVQNFVAEEDAKKKAAEVKKNFVGPINKSKSYTPPVNKNVIQSDNTKITKTPPSSQYTSEDLDYFEQNNIPKELQPYYKKQLDSWRQGDIQEQNDITQRRRDIAKQAEIDSNKGLFTQAVAENISNGYRLFDNDNFVDNWINPFQWVLNPAGNLAGNFASDAGPIDPRKVAMDAGLLALGASGFGEVLSPFAKNLARSVARSSESGVLSKAYKLNPLAFKPQGGIDNIRPTQNGFIDFKGAFQKYPKGPLTEEEINAFKNSPQYQESMQRHMDMVNQYGDAWQLPNYMEKNLDEAVQTGNRSSINPTLYGGRNWGAADYTIAGLVGSAYPGIAGAYGLAFSPPAVKNKALNSMGINVIPGGLSSKDTTIDLTNRNMNYAKVNETADGNIIIGGEFIEDSNNTVRKAKDWITANDTYSDKDYPSKDIQSFYGVQNGKFKVGKASDFNPDTEIVPRRFGEASIASAVLNGEEMRLLDSEGKPIYQNTPNTGKFILYSPSTGKAQFTYINTGKSGVDKVNAFLKENKDAQYIHLDNGRYEYYGINPEGLTDEDFKKYYEQDLERKGTPGYNLILKENGGQVYANGGGVNNEMDMITPEYLEVQKRSKLNSLINKMAQDNFNWTSKSLPEVQQYLYNIQIPELQSVVEEFGLLQPQNLVNILGVQNIPMNTMLDYGY